MAQHASVPSIVFGLIAIVGLTAIMDSVIGGVHAQWLFFPIFVVIAILAGGAVNGSGKRRR